MTRNHTEQSHFEDKYNYYYKLDFMRGVAAISVVVIHLSHRIDISSIAKRGYLAVDFFFVLSGFVMCAAYAERLKAQQLRTRDFYALRLVRIFPLAFLGTSIAAIFETLRPGVANFGEHISNIMIAYFFGALMLPTTAFNTLEPTAFPLNLPIWSLFFELLANAAFPFILKSHHKNQILIFFIASGAITFTAGVLYFGTANHGYYPNELWFGFSRISLSFSIGIVIYYFRHKSPTVNLLLPSLIFTVVVFFPYFPEYDSYIDVLSVIFIMPALVFLSIKGGNGSHGKNISHWAGVLSFPLYALHYPFTRVISVISRKFYLNPYAKCSIMISFIFVMVVISYLAYRFFDLPIRKHLIGKLRKTMIGTRETVS